jgi:chemotaxis regulatin CheY-phosphate phosphatase CheZ
MPKGKKFDAAQKHFQEKEIKLNRKMREYEASAKEALKKANAVQKENDRLRQENEALKLANKELMELHNLSDADIKALVERAHHLRSFAQLMNVMGSNPYT